MTDVFRTSLDECPVIAAVRNDKTDAALASPAETVFWLNANLMTVGGFVEKAHKAGKRIFVHIDLAEGIGKDKTGIEYLKSIGTDGIISTRQNIIRAAGEAGLITVQRVFALDSLGVSGISEAVRAAQPDFVEVMPGIAFRIIERLSKTLSVPVIAGGLIESKHDVLEALSAGAVAVSVGKEELWYI